MTDQTSPVSASAATEKAARDYEHGYNDGVEWAMTHGHAQCQQQPIDAAQEAKNLSAVIDYINNTSARHFEPNHVVCCIAFVRDRLENAVSNSSTTGNSK